MVEGKNCGAIRQKGGSHGDARGSTISSQEARLLQRGCIEQAKQRVGFLGSRAVQAAQQAGQEGR